MRQFQKPVRQRGLSVVDMRNDTKISYVRDHFTSPVKIDTIERVDMLIAGVITAT